MKTIELVFNFWLKKKSNGNICWQLEILFRESVLVVDM